MCRWLAYRGAEIFLEDMLYKPEHSLIDQSLNARESVTGTNGDGFGIGWYGERPEPGLFREVLPAWNDSNLRSIAAQIRSGRFFAHVRASTGTATSRPNCHPFTHGRWMFMHNGQIGGYVTVRRQLEGEIPDELYRSRLGTTDSELIFLMMLAAGLEESPLDAARVTLEKVIAVQEEHGVTAPFRFTAAMTDGDSLIAVRFASDPHPPTLYVAEENDRAIVVSEPLDEDGGVSWNAVPPNHFLVCSNTGASTVPI